MLKRGRGWRRGLERAFLLDQCSRRKLPRRPCLVQLRIATIVVGEAGFVGGRGEYGRGGDLVWGKLAWKSKQRVWVANGANGVWAPLWDCGRW